MTIKINLNADMAEGFGAYHIGDDDGILKIIGSANIACGFHAGDPLTMRQVVADAKRAGVSVGAHPGFNDLWGFGRRRIDMRPDDLENMIAYQIGALQALASYSGVKVTATTMTRSRKQNASVMPTAGSLYRTRRGRVTSAFLVS